MSDNDGQVYLINTTSEASAGWYDPDVAAVLLNHSSNWEKADPGSGTVAEQPALTESAPADVTD